MPPGMSPPPAQPEARRGSVVHGLLWAGVGVAPLAILVLLFSSSTGGLRMAVALAVASIVAIAVSIALRPSVEFMRIDIEERVLDEVEEIRAQIREDSHRAGQQSHRLLSDQIRELTATVVAQHAEIAAKRTEIAALSAQLGEVSAHLDELGTQLDEVQASAAVPASASMASRLAQPSGPVVRRTETVHVTRRTTTVDAGDDAPGTVYGSRAAVDADWRDHGHGRDYSPEHDHYERDRYERDHYERDHYDRDRYERGGGRERDGYERGRDYERAGGYERGQDYERGHDYERDHARASDAVASAGRWASLHADDSGQELRVGERRTSMHTTGRSAEFHVEDRWASIRRDDRGRSDERYPGESRWEQVYPAIAPYSEGPRALPAASGSATPYGADERGYGSDEPVRQRADDGSRERARSRGRERADQWVPHYGESDYPPPRPRGHYSDDYQR